MPKPMYNADNGRWHLVRVVGGLFEMTANSWPTREEAEAAQRRAESYAARQAAGR